MGEILHKKGIRKILGKILNEIYCSTVKDKLFEIANLSKNLLLGLIFNPWLCVFSPRTSFKPKLTVRNPINSPVFSLTLLKIYCIGLIGPISYSFWIWAVICDPTQAITNLSHYSKLQPTNIKKPNKERAFFSLTHTHSLLFLSNFS